MNNKIIVVGSFNTDMVLKTERFPEAKEIFLGLMCCRVCKNYSQYSVMLNE